ncbi:MAG: D-alanyl-D-alanine carboxypeptidase family protein [Lachnospiraceae bacterium]|nr:D-alanyl-D-alanine carboxypeptidase family protein [Lachnospiraceae bacterium]
MFKKIRKLLGCSLLAAALTVGSAVGVSAAVDVSATTGTYPVESDSWANWPQSPSMLAVTACLMDADTGAILYARGMDVPRFPASITKVMTALVVMEHADLNAQVAFTETGLADAYGGSSNINPTLGEVFTVDQMLQMLLVKSANDVATQLAEAVGGSVENFAAMMNQKAAELGCTNTHFANASGLENDDHYVSAHDMALIMKAAISHDRLREIMNVQSIQVPETNASGARYYDTHLQMLVPGNEYYYEGALGGKTGYTPVSGSTLVMYATRENRTLIGVVMGSQSAQLDTNGCCIDMADLFDYGFYSFSYQDMTGGYPYLWGGTALLPNGMDPAGVNVLTEETPEGVLYSYQYNGQNLGNGLMAKDTYDAMQAALQSAAETEMAAQEGTEDAVTSSSADAPEERTGNSGKSGRTVVMTIAIAVLTVSILGCIVLIILTSEGHQKKLHSQRRNRKNKKDR